MMSASDRAASTMGPISSAISELEVCQALFMRAADGSSGSDAQEVNAMFSEAIRLLSEGANIAARAASGASDVATRL